MLGSGWPLVVQCWYMAELDPSLLCSFTHSQSDLEVSAHVRRFATWVGARPLVDNILLEGRINFVFWMHEHRFNGVLTLETNLNVSVSEQLFEGFT